MCELYKFCIFHHLVAPDIAVKIVVCLKKKVLTAVFMDSWSLGKLWGWGSVTSFFVCEYASIFYNESVFSLKHVGVLQEISPLIPSYDRLNGNHVEKFNLGICLGEYQ